MTKESFTSLVTNLVLPLFTGSEIIGEEESSPRDMEVALGVNGTVLAKAHKIDEYRIIIKRNQPFKTADVSLIRNVLSEIVKISDMNLSEPEYVNRLYSTAIEKAICTAVNGEEGAGVLLGILNIIFKWSNRTYEGKKCSMGIVINNSEFAADQNENLHYTKVLEKDFFALLTDSKQSCVEFGANGYLLGYVFLEKFRAMPTLCPYDFINLAKYCNESRVAVTLLETGDVLLFSNRELVFAYRKGVWSSYSHDEIIQLLSNRTSHTMKEIRKAVYFTSLDISYAYTGGCIVYLNKEQSAQALSHIDIYDIISEKHYNLKKEQEINEYEKKKFATISSAALNNLSFNELLSKESSIKSCAIKKIIAGRKFHELNRKIRSEMVAMDGATIIDYDGTIIAIGAIVKIEAGSSGGGRLAATKTLANYGVAIKISMDGTIQCFALDKKSHRPKALFSVG